MNEIIPISLELKDFKTHKYSFIDFSKFNSAVILGAKENDDATSCAVGKSTICEAIEYVWFNEYSTKTIDKVIRRGADKATVSFVLSNDSEIYKIKRSRFKKNKSSEVLLFIMKDGEFIPLDSVRAGETDAEIRRIFKINHTAFRNASLFSQGDLSGIPSAKDSKTRFALMEEIFNLTDYSKLEKITKNNYVSLYNKEITILQTNIANLGSPKEQIEALKKTIDALDQSFKQGSIIQSKEKEKFVQISEQISILEKTTSLNDSELSLLNQIKQLDSSISEKENQKKEFSAQKDRIQAKIDGFLSERQKNTLSLKKASDEYDSLLIIPVKKIEDSKKDLAGLHLEEVDISNQIALKKNDLEKLKHQLPHEQVCPECLQEISQGYKETYQKNQLSSKNDITTSLNDAKDKLEKILAKKNKVNLDIISTESHHAKLAKLNSLKNSFVLEGSKIDGNLKSAKEAHLDLSNKLSAILDSITQIQKNKEQLNLLINPQSTGSNGFNDRLIEITNLKSEQLKITFAIEKNETLLKKMEVDRAVSLDRLKQREEDLESLKKYNESLAKKEYALLIAQEAAFGFGEEIPKSIIYGMLEELEENVGRWIEKINPDIKIDFKYSGKKDKSSEDSFEIIYSLDGVKDFEYEDLSGGQEFMVNLAFRLAISEIIQNDLGISVRLFCFDEVDERLDAATSDAFYAIIKELEKTSRILVISHTESLKNKFNHIIKVVKDDKDKSSSASLIY